MDIYDLCDALEYSDTLIINYNMGLYKSIGYILGVFTYYKIFIFMKKI